MTTGGREHWDKVHATRDPADVSWFQEYPATSMRLIRELLIDHDAPILDVGTGVHGIAAALIADGFSDVTIQDISAVAVERAMTELDADANTVRTIVGDVTTHVHDRTYVLWHDRAVFHFLTDDEDRRRYVERAAGALAPGDHAVVATFGPDGPETCSNLPVRRHSPDELAAAFASHFDSVKFETEVHVTPKDVHQQFVYGVFRRR